MIETRARPAHSLTIVSWNLFQGAGAPTGVVDHVRRHYRIFVADRSRDSLTSVSDVLGRVDVACLQEVDEGSWRNGYRNQLVEIAARARLPYRYFAAQRRGHLNDGVALASRHPLEEPRASVLVHQLERKCLLGARVRVRDRTLRVYVTHLAAFPFNGDLRRRQVEQIVRIIRESNGPFVLAADFNCDPASREMTPLFKSCGLRPVVHTATFPAYRPAHKFDNILVSAGVRILEGGVLEAPGSDHLPVWATIGLGDTDE